MAIDVKDKLVTLESLKTAFDAEGDLREAADTALGTRIDNIITPEGDASLSEVVDARLGTDGTTYASLGARINAEVSALDGEIDGVKANLDIVKNEIATITSSSVPSSVRQAIYTLFNNVAFYESDDLSAEKAILLAWSAIADTLSISADTATITGSNTVQLTATTEPARVAVSWLSMNEDVATVDQTGLVTGVGNGTTRIVAVCGNLSASCTVTVSGFVMYNITNNLTDCISSNLLTQIAHGSAYTATITATTGMVTTCHCTMGGIEQAVLNNSINIESVTGDIIITAVASDPNLVYSATNLVFDGTNYVNTGVELFSEENINKDFLIELEIANIGRAYDDNFGVIIGSMDESVSSYPGFTVCVPIQNRLLVLGADEVLRLQDQYVDTPLKLSIKRIGVTYLAWINDDETNAVGPSRAIRTIVFENIPVTLGCELDSNKNPFRYWVGTINNIIIKWI